MGFGGVHVFPRARDLTFSFHFSLWHLGKKKACHKWTIQWPDHAPKAMHLMSTDATVHESAPAGLTFNSI